MKIRELDRLTLNNKIEETKIALNDIYSSSHLLLNGISTPNESVRCLHDIFLKHATLCSSQRKLTQHPPGINSEENVLWLISSGSITIYRYCDDLKIGLLEAPQIAGLQDLFSPFPRYYFRVSKCSKTSFIPINKAREILNQKHLWSKVSEIFAFYLRLMTYREETMTCRSSYEIIKSKLIEYMNYKDSFSISNKGIVAYISSTTTLSRSSIYRILEKLKSRNFIKIHKGKLKEITFLPEDM